MKPLAVDLFAGLGGWTDGLLEEGWDVIGFDNVRHVYGEHRYPAQLVVQDVLTLHGSQFRNSALIVASPPCQEFSYMAMPWTIAKTKAQAIREDATGAKLADLTRLFDACFRIQREACDAAGRHIPMVVENVKGAQPWVGRARAHYGSFYLWGDVPALLPTTATFKSKGLNWSDRSKPCDDTRQAGEQAMNVNGGVKQHGSGALWFDTALDERRKNPDGVKVSGKWFGSYADMKAAGKISPGRMHGKGSTKRKFASAMIAKIPLELSRHIAATFK